jgi:hypothetical protein
MRPLNGIEKSAVAVAAVFIFGGAVIATRPVEITYSPDTRSRNSSGFSRPVHLSKEDARVGGWISVALGLGLGYVALFVGRK